MQLPTIILALNLAFLTQAASKLRFDPGVSMGSHLRNNDVYIKHFKTTLNLGAVPQDPRNVLVVWPGLITERDHLIQAIAGSMDGETNLHCDARNEKWCLFSYV
jgi:hypothetical protein